MKTENSNMIQIDGARLKKAIDKRGVTIYEASIALEHSKNFLSNIIRSGRIHRSTVTSLASVYGINLAEYALIEEKPAEAKTDELAELEEIIAKGVLRALEEFKEEHGPEAIVKAMEKWRTER